MSASTDDYAMPAEVSDMGNRFDLPLGTYTGDVNVSGTGRQVEDIYLH